MNSQTQRTLGLVIIVIGIVALAAPRLRSQATGQGPEHFQRSFTISPNGTLHVDNYKGTIHVTASDGNQVVVDVTKRFEGGSESDRKWWMENLQVNFSNQSDRVSVDVKYPQWSCTFCWQGPDFTAQVELEIRVPRQINVALESYKPDIKIASVQGDIRIKSYKSPITIDSTTGAIRIDTYKDTIRLLNVTLRGPLEIQSYKADAEINTKALGETVSLETEKGSIVLRVPQNTGMDVDYSGSRRASFRSDFPVSATTGSFSESFRGVINHGGTRLRLRTERGSVSLEKLSGQM
jgi:hypothetical protein